jgi:hypothetical protein
MRPDSTKRETPRGESRPRNWTQSIESVIDDQNRPSASIEMIRDPPQSECADLRSRTIHAASLSRPSAGVNYSARKFSHSAA